VLDASGSMLGRMGGKRRIDVAKEVLAELGGSLLPEGTTLALRAFGHRRGLGCKSELVLPPAPLERAGYLAAVAKLTAISNAKTALAEAIRNAGADLAVTEGRRLIVLVTDGDETCGGDPAAEVAALAAQGIDVRLNVVGFAVADAGLREKLEAWAAAGGGAYFDAADQAALAAALQGAVGRPLTVYDAAGAEVARGLVGGAPLELPAGRYRVRIGEAEYEAEVPPGEEVVLSVAPG
jgi:Mg-chelatase subunit ChlD